MDNAAMAETQNSKLKTQNSLGSLLIYLVFIFVGGALIAPWIYFATQSAGEHFSIFYRLAQNPFHRFVHRAILGLAIVGLWPLCKNLGINSWNEIGIVPLRNQSRKVFNGFLFGFFSFACVAILALAIGAKKINPQHNAAEILKSFSVAISTAIVV